MIREGQRVRKKGTKPEEGQIVKIKEVLQKKVRRYSYEPVKIFIV